MSPALAGRFSTTAPPGKPQGVLLKQTMVESGEGAFPAVRTVRTTARRLRSSGRFEALRVLGQGDPVVQVRVVGRERAAPSR